MAEANAEKFKKAAAHWKHQTTKAKEEGAAAVAAAKEASSTTTTNLTALLGRLQSVRSSRVCNDAPVFASFSPLLATLREDGVSVGEFLKCKEEVTKLSKSMRRAEAELETAQASVRAEALAAHADETRLAKARSVRDEKLDALADEFDMTAELILAEVADLVGESSLNAEQLSQQADKAATTADQMAGALAGARQAAAAQPTLGSGAPTPEQDVAVSDALARVDSYVSAFSGTPGATKQVEEAAADLQQALRALDLRTPSAAYDSSSIEACLSALAAALAAEETYWAQFNPLEAFPAGVLLSAASGEEEQRRAVAVLLQEVLESVTDLKAKHQKLQQNLEFDVAELDRETREVRESSKCASEDLEDAERELKKATRRGESGIQQLEASVTEAKDRVRQAQTAERAVHKQLFERLVDFPELRQLLPSGMPAELLPYFQESRSLEHFEERSKLPGISRNTLWKASIDGRLVALKEFRVDSSMIKTCYQEAALLLKCRHPSVVELEGIFHSGHFFYLQMPFYPNGTLKTLCEQKRPSVRSLIELLFPLSQALAHLDAKGVVHSDIKPENVLIDAQERPRLADFDVSVSTSERRTVAFAKTIMAHGGGGTIGFMAPEVMAGGAAELSSKSDVYSLGKCFESVAVAAGLLALGWMSANATPDAPLQQILRGMLSEQPSARPTAAEVSAHTQEGLVQIGRLEAQTARHELDKEAQALTAQKDKLEQSMREQQRQLEEEMRTQKNESLKTQAKEQEVAQRSRELQRKLDEIERKRQEAKTEGSRLARMKELLSTPAYWEQKLASKAADGFAMIGLDRNRERTTWQALSQMLDTEGKELGHGADHKHKSPPYNKLKLAAAWRIEHPALWDKYAGGRRTVITGMQRVTQSGKRRADPNIRTHAAAASLPGGLSADAGEEMLLHGTAPGNVLSVLSTGLNEHFSGLGAGTAFGDGLYFAEDAGKNDHYVTMDEAHDGSSDLHKRLYAHGVRHPSRVFYLLVCRVAVGYYVRTKSNPHASLTSPDTGEKIFPVTRRELSPVSGVSPAVFHHTLLAEHQANGGPFRYRELIIFQNSHVYPEYLIAYQRYHDSRGPLQ